MFKVWHKEKEQFALAYLEQNVLDVPMHTFPIIQKAGGRKAITEIVTHPTHGRVGIHAVRMWEQRGRIPGYAIADLLEWCERSGISFTQADFRAEARASHRKRRPA